MVQCHHKCYSSQGLRSYATDSHCHQSQTCQLVQVVAQRTDAVCDKFFTFFNIPTFSWEEARSSLHAVIRKLWHLDWVLSNPSSEIRLAFFLLAKREENSLPNISFIKGKKYWTETRVNLKLYTARIQDSSQHDKCKTFQFMEKVTLISFFLLKKTNSSVQNHSKWVSKMLNRVQWHDQS